MADLRTLLDDAVAARVIPAPPLDAVTQRGESIRARQARLRLAGTAVGVIGLLAAATLTWATWDDDERTRLAVRPGPSVGTTAPIAPDRASPPSSAPAPSRPGASKAPADDTGGGDKLSLPAPDVPSRLPECKAGANGGATEVGVTGRRIDLVMTAALDGPLRSVGEQATFAVKTVFDRVNRSGGICGRLLSLRVLGADQGPEHWPPDPSAFTAIVGPLQRSLDRHIADGAVDRARMPVVGTDGLSADQFRSRWVWPVGTPAASMVRIAVDHAYDALGARTFALVHDTAAGWDDAEAALRHYVSTLPGASVRTVHRLDPEKPSYSQQAMAFNEACRDEACDVTLLGLLPDTLAKWLNAQPERARLQTAVLRFVSERTCTGDEPACLGVDAWVGYTPPTGAFLRDPDVATYAEHVGHENPLTQGAYVGALVLEEALKRVGPTVTRARLQEVLDTFRFESGLAATLSWGPTIPSNRVANRWARLVHIGKTIEDAGTGWMRDPMPGVFPE